MFVYHMGGCPVRVPTKDAWLEALRLGLQRPKPPEWWLKSQELDGRNRQQASIIWGSRYNHGRRYIIWSQAPMNDFISLGYLEG